MLEFIMKYWIELLMTSLTGGIAYMVRQYIGLKHGMKALIRNEIVRIYETRTSEGFCPSYMKENIKEMYENYHQLGGNGMITTMVNKIYDLPNFKKEITK